MTAPEPSFANMALHLHKAADEASLLSTIPIIQQGPKIIQLLTEIRADNQAIRVSIQEIRNEIRVLDERLGRVEGQVQTLNRHHDLLPLRLYNSTLPLEAAIKYPPDIGPFPRPANKSELGRCTKQHCVDLIRGLGLQPVRGDAHVAVFRKRIGDYLGVLI